MLRKPADSTTMRSVGYEAKSRVLEIEFDSGAVYQYMGLPTRTHERLMAVESKGRYFNDEIRDCYSYLQVRRTGTAK
jgi:hypothetical protein